MGLPYATEDILTEAKLALKRAAKDQDALSALGVTRDWLEQYREEIRTAEHLPDEEVRQLRLEEKTEQKDEALAACYGWADNLQERIRFQYGAASSQYQRFPTDEKNEARTSERKMAPLMETLIQYAANLAGDADGQGASSEFADEGRTLLRALRSADQAQEAQKVDNLAATREQTEVFRTLYRKVNRINRAGRTVFRDDPARRARYRSPWHKYNKR